MTTPISMTVRTVEDVLALVPVVLGFAPTDSVVMLTFGAARSFHARCDLPASADDLPGAAAVLVEPAVTHRVQHVILVVYSEDRWLVTEAAWAMWGAFERAGVGVLEVIGTDGRRWFPALGERPDVPVAGVSYDVSAHPFRAEAVADGRVLLGSREALRDELATDPVRTGRVVAALAGLTGDPPRAEERAVEAAWADGVVRDHVVGDRAGDIPSDADVARLLRGLLDSTVRDAAASSLTRWTARGHVAFWTDMVRRTPVPMLAAPAALLALAAWQAGQGALAWCALDRSAEADETYPLAALVARVLEQALEPEAWDGVCEG
ncbi:DUF4192 domain-containing protein [Nocardioides sp.]|uniref:DUF4192 domain-containing protein n=1 Tax=Nocardioides sp. TaxID=35761 RepID=UPI0025ED5A03|nr:DUF4192 domain-containing protein [Nocardioides sp.]